MTPDLEKLKDGGSEAEEEAAVANEDLSSYDTEADRKKSTGAEPSRADRMEELVSQLPKSVEQRNKANHAP